MNFYSVIIGTELLNGRRNDAHFSFLNKELIKRSWVHKASFVIKDDPQLIQDIFTLIKNDPNSVMFCFGGIGATPDDFTRVCAANVFTNSKMKTDQKAKELIINEFKENAYPHRINMAKLPLHASLLKNVVNNVPGFYLQNRFFFVPGFPSMAHDMIIEALDTHYIKNKQETYALVMTAYISEDALINTMKEISSDVEFSSLPIIQDDEKHAVISISSNNEKLTKSEFKKFTTFCDLSNIKYVLEDIRR